MTDLDKRIAEIVELDKNRTQGKWQYCNWGGKDPIVKAPLQRFEPLICELKKLPEYSSNGKLIGAIPEMVDIILHLQAELRELKSQVEFVEADAKAQKGDVVDLDVFGFAIVTEVNGNNIDCALLRDGQLMTGYFFRNFGKYPIIQRNGKPAIKRPTE